MLKSFFICSFIAYLFLCGDVISQTADSIVLEEGLVIKLERRQGGQIISPNAVAASIETGQWNIPSENDDFKFNDKIIGTWEKIIADESGWFKGELLVNSYVHFEYEAVKDGIVLIEPMGNSMFYVNGSARSGNPYRYKDGYEEWEPRFDYSLIPVKLKKGSNSFLFECNRGLLKVKINFDTQGLIFNEYDLTIPDIVVGEAVDSYGAIPIINATENLYTDLLVKTWSGDSEPEYYPLNQIQPLSIFKTPFYINLPAQQDTGFVKLNIELVQKEGGNENVLSSHSIKLKAVNYGEKRRETFVSNMDGSVQYYAVNPPENLKYDKPALFLSLHGAGVEAINQAQAYGHKNWGYIVAPTNRRPYGYNWENWGRMDALEVLDIAKNKFNIDEDRVYLTGHSMGGHGTWHLGINYPDKFAAIGPSAGWISIWSYRIRPESDSADVEKMLIRSTKQSDTYAFSTNLKNNGIYIIHGDADDNVPPEQAKSMIENLSKFHKDFIYHEEPGAGHWWDNSDEPGADCVDWAPMFDFFAHHSVPRKDMIRNIDFVTANPSASSKNYWIEIINQIEQQKLSKINIRLEFGNQKFVGTTDNIEMLAIDASMLPESDTISVELDNQLIEGISITDDSNILLKKENGEWTTQNEIDKNNKYPKRCGNFREVLNNQVLFVYGTQGNKEENKWAFEKARYDAERIWYRGNGSIEIIKDDEFDPVKYKDRNVLLFGNSETNSAWNLLLKDSPVQIDNEKIITGKKEYKGKDLACLMIRPRTDSEFATVGVVSGTGIDGMRLANFALYYHQYLGLPDIVIYDSDILKSDREGIKSAGYFGNDWSIERGEFVKR